MAENLLCCHIIWTERNGLTMAQFYQNVRPSLQWEKKKKKAEPAWTEKSCEMEADRARGGAWAGVGGDGAQTQNNTKNDRTTLESNLGALIRATLNGRDEQSWGGTACLMRFCEHTSASISPCVMGKKEIVGPGCENLWMAVNLTWLLNTKGPLIWIRGLIKHRQRKHTEGFYPCGATLYIN